MHILKLLNYLVRSLFQNCRSLSHQKRCPGCTTRRWIYFVPQKIWNASRFCVSSLLDRYDLYMAYC